LLHGERQNEGIGLPSRAAKTPIVFSGKAEGGFQNGRAGLLQVLRPAGLSTSSLKPARTAMAGTFSKK
jgi:hypothetical protein